ncbi:MAG: ROK family protein [Methanomicrobia archaeon]|nr:ROK family protein [Methanomicrobia archaeon]
MAYSLGIDIGATYVRLGIVSQDGSLITSINESVTDQRTPQGLVDQLLALYHRLPLKDYPIIGVGVGIPGPVKPDTGYVYVFPNLQIEAFDIAEALEQALHLPIKVTNDANAAAFGEALLGAGKGYKVVQFITISTGIGGGLVMDGKLVTGRYGFAQEIGNMVLSPSGPRPNPSMNPGSWEAYCSGSALVRQANEAGFPVTHAGEVFSNPALKGLVDIWLNFMAIAIANMTTLYEPDIFVLGGGVMKSQKLFLESLQKKVNDYLLPGLKEKLLILPAKLNQDAGLIGAGLLPLFLK